ncbi:hypothetical protein [Frankia sp. Cr2]|uniref:hypothetical protein n=1 Tax=Frankia sp. Cr2 TaxID=3073932 RepID=UPI002AD5044B|nr:hypothetical protein [Frankia sp. Cr2]
MSGARVVLTSADEYLHHQAVATFDEVTTTDRNWTEKGYVVGYATNGSVMAGIGIGKYPNRNVMDAFATIAVPGWQYNVRASRDLRPGIESTTVGPVVWDIIEPLKKIRVALLDNDYGVSCDLLYEGYFPPVVGSPGFRRDNGITSNHTLRYYQPGRTSGTVTVEGVTHTIDADNSYGYRDRSWGVRGIAGVPPEGSFLFDDASGQPETGLRPASPTPAGLLHGYLNLIFPGFAVSSTFTQGPDGTPVPSSTGSSEGFVAFPTETGRPPIAIVDLELNFEFFAGTRRARGLEASVLLADGTKKQITCSWKNLVFYFRGGAYFGFRGWWHGKYMGAPLVVGGEKLDLTDKAVLDELYSVEEIAVDCTCDGERGHGVIEPWVIGEMPRYGISHEHLG